MSGVYRGLQMAWHISRARLSLAPELRPPYCLTEDCCPGADYRACADDQSGAQVLSQRAQVKGLWAGLAGGTCRRRSTIICREREGCSFLKMCEQEIAMIASMASDECKCLRVHLPRLRPRCLGEARRAAAKRRVRVRHDRGCSRRGSRLARSSAPSPVTPQRMGEGPSPGQIAAGLRRHELATPPLYRADRLRRSGGTSYRCDRQS